MLVKKVWVTSQGENTDLVSITIESQTVPDDEAWKRVTADETAFPVVPAGIPHRHTICLRLFDQEDINYISQVLDKVRTDK